MKIYFHRSCHCYLGGRNAVVVSTTVLCSPSTAFRNKKHYSFLTALCSSLNHTDQILYCIWFQNMATNTCDTQQQLSLQVLRELSALVTEPSYQQFHVTCVESRTKAVVRDVRQQIPMYHLHVNIFVCKTQISKALR
jgi:hypothetical protein